MKIKEIREFDQEALGAKVKDLAEELFRLKFQHNIRPLDNTAKLRQLKHDIARLKTVMKEQQG
jgi:large subunit ribosomal protein L29